MATNRISDAELNWVIESLETTAEPKLVGLVKAMKLELKERRSEEKKPWWKTDASIPDVK
jgi:hypothetical protein